MSWDPILQWLKDASPTELYAIALTLLCTGLIGLVIRMHRVRKARARLLQGDRLERVVFQLNKLHFEGDVPVLMIRNLPGGGTVHSVMYGDPALEAVVARLAADTTAGNPLLQFRGVEQGQALHEFVSRVTQESAIGSFTLRPLVFAVTCEDRRLVRRVQVRPFLMDRDELLRFLDPDFCVRVKVEKPGHAVRVIALHCWAKELQAQEAETNPAPDQLKLSRIVELPLRDDYRPVASVEIDWTSGLEAQALQDAGLETLFQAAERRVEGTRK